MLKIDIVFSFPFPKAMLRGMTDSALRTPFHHLPSFLSHWTPLFQTFITLCPGLWVELCPPKLYAQVLTLHTCERTLFGNMVFEDTIKLKWSHTGLSSVQSLTRVPLFVTPWIAATRPPCPSPTPGAYQNNLKQLIFFSLNESSSKVGRMSRYR